MTEVADSRVDESDICRMCKHNRQWHRENRPRHPFTPEGGSLAFMDSKQSKKEAAKENHPSNRVKVLPGLPNDPALRILLLELGLITQDQINDVESRIRNAQATGNIIIVTPGVSANSRRGTESDSGLGDRGSAQGSLWPGDAGSDRVQSPPVDQ